MAELKTRPTSASVTAFLARIEDPLRRRECHTIAKLMRRATGARARLWGDSIVGFGRYHYQYASGREGDWFLTGFSPRKGNLTVYIMPGLAEYTALLQRLGKHSRGKSCLYIPRLDDIDLAVLDRLIARSVRRLAKQRV